MASVPAFLSEVCIQAPWDPLPGSTATQPHAWRAAQPQPQDQVEQAACSSCTWLRAEAAALQQLENATCLYVEPVRPGHADVLHAIVGLVRQREAPRLGLGAGLLGRRAGRQLQPAGRDGQLLLRHRMTLHSMLWVSTPGRVTLHTMLVVMPLLA